MELSKSIGFPFRDPHWMPRALLGGFFRGVSEILALPLVFAIGRHGFHLSWRSNSLVLFALALSIPFRLIILGYFRRIVRGASNHSLPGLPPWDQFGDDLIGGIRLFFVSVALFLPTIAFLILTTLFVGTSTPNFTPLILILFAIPMVGLTLFYLPAALVLAISSGDLTAAFDLKRVFSKIGQNLGFYLIAFLITVAAKILSQVGLILCCVGVFFTGFLADVITAHVFASVFAETQDDSTSHALQPPEIPHLP